MTISPTLGHGHIWAADKVGEIYAFADAVTRGKPQLARITRTEWRPDWPKVKYTVAGHGTRFRTAKSLTTREKGVCCTHAMRTEKSVLIGCFL